MCTQETMRQTLDAKFHYAMRWAFRLSTPSKLTLNARVKKGRYGNGRCLDHPQKMCMRSPLQHVHLSGCDSGTGIGPTNHTCHHRDIARTMHYLFLRG